MTRTLPPRGPSTTTRALLALTALLAAALALTATTPAPAQAATPALHQGTGLHAAPSVRVRALQRALHARGYRLGPAGIDGRFGPATAAAVRRLQAHHHLTTDAIVGPRTRRALHLTPPAHRTAATRRTHTTTTRTTPRAGVPPAAAPTWPTTPHALAPAATPPAPTAPSLSTARARSIAIALLVSALALAIWLTPRRRPPPTPHDHAILPPGRRVIAYVDTTTDHHGHTADKIEKTCARHHWHLLELVTEHRHRPATQRPGLTYALDRIHHGHADALIIKDLHHLDPKPQTHHHITRALHNTGAALITCTHAPHTITPPPQPGRWRTIATNKTTHRPNPTRHTTHDDLTAATTIARHHRT